MNDRMPRLMFAAPKSGSGKTMITCGMIEVWKRRKLNIAALKCGPDYLDPMFHRKVLGGGESGNLDTFFTDEETTRYLLWKRAKDADLTLIEGVMGYYDGLGGKFGRSSTYEIAKVTKTPVILIVNAGGVRGAEVSGESGLTAAEALTAEIKEIIKGQEDSNIRGIILNRAPADFYEAWKERIERECGAEVLGYIPELTGCSVPSRHLGLLAPEELAAFDEWAGKTADAIEKSIRLNRLLAIAQEAEFCCGQAPLLPKLPGTVRLAVARDEAFSFYYRENLELLAQMGAELVYFSPLHDEKLPEEIDGMILGGGYPELYAKELEEAEELRQEVRKVIRNGLPCLAECGGFMYLQEELEGADGNVRKMAGLLSGRVFRTGKLCRFGYIEAESRTAGVLGDGHGCLKGHEFHYWDCTENGTGFLAKKPARAAEYPCMVYTKTLAAGFPHFYYYSNPDMVYQFLLACRSFQAGRQAKAHWDSIAKPIDSLGLLEEDVVKLCRIAGSPAPTDLKKRALIILCGDHGVVAEGVTQTGKEVTRIVSENFAKGCSSVNYMAESAGTDVYVADIGMDTPAYPEKRLVQGAVIDRKIARGSGNIASEPAMTAEQCRQALAVGTELVRGLKEKGYRILATGEMGIGNTTPTSALAAVFLQQQAEKVTGKGAGLSAEGIRKKCRVVEAAAERIRRKGLTDAVEILAEAGGYEIAGMAGVFLGAVKYRIPVVIDGAISAVAALTAARLDGRVPDFVLASHEPLELAGKLALKELGLSAILHARMCLGEGTGAVAVFPVLDMAMEVYKSMGTFTEYQIDPYSRFEQEV